MAAHPADRRGGVRQLRRPAAAHRPRDGGAGRGVRPAQLEEYRKAGRGAEAAPKHSETGDKGKEKEKEKEKEKKDPEKDLSSLTFNGRSTTQYLARMYWGLAAFLLVVTCLVSLAFSGRVAYHSLAALPRGPGWVSWAAVCGAALGGTVAALATNGDFNVARQMFGVIELQPDRALPGYRQWVHALDAIGLVTMCAITAAASALLAPNRPRTSGCSGTSSSGTARCCTWRPSASARRC